MPDVEIHWQVNSSAGCFHTAECLLRGEPLQSEALAEAFAPLVDRLRPIIDASGLPAGTFLTHLVPLSAQLESNRPLATALLAKTFGPRNGEGYLSQLTNLLSEFERTYEQHVPSPAEQLAESAAGLRQHWNAWGQTMLAGIAQLIEPEAIVESARVLLLSPVCSGGGRAYFLYNSVGIEVVATEPTGQLLEIVRLCWLIAQLNADLPMYQGEIHRDRLVEIVPLAMLPAALTAASELGLTKCDKATLSVALENWVRVSSELNSTSDPLWNWWETYIKRKPRWPVALAALDKLLRADEA